MFKAVVIMIIGSNKNQFLTERNAMPRKGRILASM